MSNITTEQKDGVLTVRFARIEKKNALTRAMYESLCDAFKKAEDSDDVRVLVLAGQEGIFTAGNDLADFLADPPSGEESPVFRFLRALVSFPKPLVASVDGPAIGLGTTLLLHCDAVVVTTRALLKMPFTQLGLVPEAASSALLPLIVGPVLARYWLLSSTGISGEEAYRTGLASHITWRLAPGSWPRSSPPARCSPCANPKSSCGRRSSPSCSRRSPAKLPCSPSAWRTPRPLRP
jgi:enoyl-CoA hydratase/carnithine racemase